MPGLRDRVAHWRWRLLLPALLRLDTVDEGLAATASRLDAVDRRLDRIEQLIQATGTRVATASEESSSFAESEARIAGRVEEIERLLGGRTADR